MIMRFNRNYLDFKQGKDYEITNKDQQKYYKSMSIAKDLTSLDGTPIEEIGETFNFEKPEVDFADISLEEQTEEQTKPAKKGKAKVSKKKIVDPDNLFSF